MFEVKDSLYYCSVRFKQWARRKKRSVLALKRWGGTAKLRDKNIRLNSKRKAVIVNKHQN